MTSATPSLVGADEALLREAFADAVAADAAIRRFAREPLGAGSVSGFTIGEGADELVAFVDTSRQRVDVETGSVLAGDDGAVEARVWLHPADPHLPALAPAAFGHAAATLLARAGIRATGTPAIVAYRPGRRAVLRVATDEEAAASDVWVKVVRPSRVERIVEIHTLLATHGILVPRVRAWSPEGLLVIDGAVGEPALEADVAPARLVAAVDALRERISRVPFPHSARTSLTARVDWYAGRLSPRTDALAAGIRAIVASEPVGERRGIHGDLHLGQLFVSPAGEVTGLIDVDTAGAGDPAEDAGAFVAHAVSSALLSRGSARAPGLVEIARVALAAWGGDSAVRARVALQLLGHAVGADDTGDADRRDVLLAAAAGVLAGDAEALAAVADAAPGAASEPKNALTGVFETP